MKQFKDFLSIKEGDIIIANKGYSEILGMGTVKGSYQYRPDLTFNHTYPLEWFDTKERDILPRTGVWRKTVSPVDADLYNKIISGTWKNYLVLRHQPDFKCDKSERTYWNYFNTPDRVAPTQSKMIWRTLIRQLLRILLPHS